METLSIELAKRTRVSVTTTNNWQSHRSVGQQLAQHRGSCLQRAHQLTEKNDAVMRRRWRKTFSPKPRSLVIRMRLNLGISMTHRRDSACLRVNPEYVVPLSFSQSATAGPVHSSPNSFRRAPHQRTKEAASSALVAKRKQAGIFFCQTCIILFISADVAP